MTNEIALGVLALLGLIVSPILTYFLGKRVSDSSALLIEVKTVREWASARGELEAQIELLSDGLRDERKARQRDKEETAERFRSFQSTIDELSEENVVLKKKMKLLEITNAQQQKSMRELFLGNAKNVEMMEKHGVPPAYKPSSKHYRG